MCGIVGVVGKFSSAEGNALVARMNRTIVHRGPDDYGEWASEGVAFGMRRLSIIDLAGGHQPMWTADGIGIVFNGEIYNYRQLRAKLEGSGYTFKTKSDTEVILNLYHRDGLTAISRLEGMFAICLYDPRQQALHLVRDRLGVKPLYWGEESGVFFFASEIKAILAGMAQRPNLNLQALHHYLTLRFIPSPATVWQGIYKLPPGQVLSISLESRQREMRRYWEVRFQSEPCDPGRDFRKEFEELFLAAVEKRLLASDVPVGVLLSGGLDSSAVSAAAVELGHRDFHTFSVAFSDGGRFDECPYAREVARHIGSQHHEVIVGQQEFMDFLPELVRFTDEPLADLAGIPLYYVCRLARGDVKVVLSGEGSDEVLAGYNFDRLARFLEQLQLLEKTIPRLILRTAGRLLGANSIGAGLCSLANNGWRRAFADQHYHMTNYWSEAEKLRLWRLPNRFESSQELIASWYTAASSPHPLDQLQQVYCGDWLVEDLLMKADKMSMANSLELREPFLDHKLVEWAACLPLAWKVGTRTDGFSSKRILREFAASRLPASILRRPKQGFPVPAYQWLQGRLGDWVKEQIFTPKSRLADIFALPMLHEVLARSRKGDSEVSHRVWILIVLEYWLRAWH